MCLRVVDISKASTLSCTWYQRVFAFSPIVIHTYTHIQTGGQRQDVKGIIRSVSQRRHSAESRVTGSYVANLWSLAWYVVAVVYTHSYVHVHLPLPARSRARARVCVLLVGTRRMRLSCAYLPFTLVLVCITKDNKTQLTTSWDSWLW